MSDTAFRKFVQGFARLGYGRMMQIVSEEWYKSAVRRGDPISGVSVAYPIGLLLEDRQQEAIHEKEIMTGVKAVKRE